jgi:signal peptidase I
MERAKGDGDVSFPYTVPNDRYFVMGDRRTVSVDSRNSVIGAIEKDQIVGKIMFRIWPLDKIGRVG